MLEKIKMQEEVTWHRALHTAGRMVQKESYVDLALTGRQFESEL
jgi:hypothetical protein